MKMGNKSLFQIFSLLLGVIIFTSCKDRFPPEPTIVNGKVEDESGNPLAAVGINFNGTNQKGITLIPTFDIYTITDKDGKFKVSYTIPKKTDWVEIQIIDHGRIIDGIALDTGIINRYIPYSFNGELIVEGKSTIGSRYYGKTLEANFVLKKK